MQCEIDPFCQSILRYHFPSAHLYGDIRDIDGTQWKGKIDILTGGFPCQPFSAAGRRRGTEDNRFLWPEMLRIIRETRPTWIVAENVRGIVSIDGGMVFERVCSDLETNGYEVQPFCIPACGIGTFHERNRIFFIAHAKSKPRGNERRNIQKKTERPSIQLPEPRFSNNSCATAVDFSERFTECERFSKGWLQAATRLCRVDDGLPRELDGITVPKWRRESLKAYGNAIVPQVAYQIFRVIDAAHSKYFPPVK